MKGDRILIYILALGSLLGGAFVLDARVESKIDRTLAPHLEYIKQELKEIKEVLRVRIKKTD